jgi:DNA polymerase sigma
MKELTEGQIRRQDLIDNAIYQLIQIVNPTDKNIEWDIEMIGEVRDIIREWIVDRMKITDEQTFYPYIDD